MSATNRGERRGEGTIADVLAGRAQWVVVEGDCLQVLPMLPEKSVAHAIFDAPYEAEAHTLQRRIFNGGADRGGGIKAAPLSFPPWTPKERQLVARGVVAATRGWAMTFCQIEAVALWKASFLRAGARWIRGQVWRKPNGQPQMTGDRPGMGFECIATAYCAPGRVAWNGGGAHGWYEPEADALYVHAVDANFSRDDRVHETQKPLSLMKELIEKFTAPGDLVLDCCAGSGTTGVAALALGRRCIMIEMNPEHVATARLRCDAEARGLPLRAVRETNSGQLPLLAGV